MKKLFSSEMVCVGHPDKICDKIADSILDDYLLHDKDSRVAIEVSISFRRVFIMGEVSSKWVSDMEGIAREVICDIGYDNDSVGFNGRNVEVIIDVHRQSVDIFNCVNKEEIGAGDQGIIYGYASDETEYYLPLGYVLASKLSSKLEEVRKSGILPYLGMDGKMQVTVEYDGNRVSRVDSVVLSVQHDEVDMDVLRRDVEREVIRKVIPEELFIDCKLYINPSGRFVIGGPVGDSGLTGRKIVCDSYGGYARHGGGAYSGKDYTKVDRSAAYYARYVCKNLVAAGVAHRLEIQVSYAIGMSREISIYIDSFGTNQISDEKIMEVIDKFFDFSPSNMIEELDLANIRYSELSNYGHFMHSAYPMEKLDKVDKIKRYMESFFN